MCGSVFLETRRLVLKHITEQDFCAIREIQRNPVTMKYFGGQLTDEKIASNFYDLLLRHQNRYGFSLGPVYERNTGKLIGNAGVVHLDFEDVPELELGYFISPDYWGKGYATELAAALIPHGFKMGAPAIYATIDKGNVASCRVSEKLNMRLEGERGYATLDGKPLLYYVADKDWKAPQ